MLRKACHYFTTLFTPSLFEHTRAPSTYAQLNDKIEADFVAWWEAAQAAADTTGDAGDARLHGVLRLVEEFGLAGRLLADGGTATTGDDDGAAPRVTVHALGSVAGLKAAIEAGIGGGASLEPAGDDPTGNGAHTVVTVRVVAMATPTAA